MDQSYTNLPRFTENFKSETGLAHIHHHLTGVLSHGTKKSYVYTWTDLFSSDCNVTLNSLIPTMDFCFQFCICKQTTQPKLTVLMEGQAHEDIYQMFSCISKKAQTHKLITFQTFMTWFRQASHQSWMQDIWKVCGISRKWCHRGMSTRHKGSTCVKTYENVQQSDPLVQ